MTKSLEPQALAKHKAQVGFELEVLSRKTDRFGWDAMNQHVRQRLLQDWIGRLADYTVEEIQTAIRQLLASEPKQAANEERVAEVINAERGKRVARLPKQESYAPVASPTAEERARASELLAASGFAPKRFGGDA